MVKQKITFKEDEKLYILDIAKLKKGDIILESGDSWYSNGIKLATNSQYSHAKICWSQGSCIEALSDGVHSNNIKRTLYKQPSDVKVLRYKKDITPYIDRIVSSVRSKIGTPYSTLLAIGTKISFITDDDRKQFCSKLVALAFKDAGINLVQEAEICTPADLENSQELECVNDCINLATQEEIEFAKSENFLEVQKKSTNFLIDECSKLANAEFLTLQDVESFLINNREFDQCFSDILQKSGYLTLLEDFEIPKNKYRYDDNELDKLLNIKDINLISEYKLQRDLYKRHYETYIQAQKMLRNLNLKYFYLINDLYFRLVNIHFNSAKRFLIRIEHKNSSSSRTEQK